MLRYFFAIFILVSITVIALTGFRGQHSPKPPIEIFPDMDHQPKFDPQHENLFFADGRSGRVPVAGTVPIGYVLPNAYSTTGANNSKISNAMGAFASAPDYYNTGKIGDSYGDGLPVEVNPALLQRGQERFTINCAICHGAVGAGNGIVSQYGLNAVANFHQDRLRTMPDGQIFNTITNGKNTMGAYGPQIAVEDRWAIIAYIRALQRSQNAKLTDVPEQDRAALDTPAPAPAASPEAKK
jgi:mono/diheme cytochrome c family protein